MEARVLALDIGTSSLRAMLFDAAGNAVPGALARRASPLVIDDHGRAELDPDATFAAIGDCLDELGDRGELDGVERAAIACAWHSVIALDHDGKPLTGALTWADTRAAGMAAELRARPEVAGLHARTGALVHTTYWTVKVPWLARETGGAAARYLGIGEYLTGRLLGERGASLSLASGTGLLDLDARAWDPGACALAGAGPESLPELLEPGWTGELLPELARRWPALAGVPWHAPVGDGAAANAGAGCLTPDRVAITIGTSAAVRAIHGGGAGPLPRELWRYHVDAKRLVSGAAFSGAGNLYAWCRRVLGLHGEREVEEALASVPPGGRGVLVLPYHAGARAPLDLAAGAGVVGGLSLATTAVEVVAATFEAVCFQLAAGLTALEEEVGPAREVVACGGAVVASPWWQQTLADVLDRPLRVVDEPEASARGAALLALAGGGETPPWQPSGGQREVHPRPGAAAAERATREAHRDFARRLGIS